MGGGAHPDRARARALHSGDPGAGDSRHPDRCVRAAAREPLAAGEVRRAQAPLPLGLKPDRDATRARPPRPASLAAGILTIPRTSWTRYDPPRGVDSPPGGEAWR